MNSTNNIITEHNYKCTLMGKIDVNMNNRFVSIIILAYNSCNDLKECLPSLINQTYKNYEIIIVDNASTDDTEKFMKNNYPKIKLIESKINLGYAGGNNLGFEYSQGDYIVILNPDVYVNNDWLYELIKPLNVDPSIGMTTSKIFEYSEPNHAACGNVPHYTGLHFPRGLEKSESLFIKNELVGSISGCSFAIRRAIFEDLSGFDSSFFLYMEDSDLSLRARLSGNKILFASKSILYHKHKTIITPEKEYYLERNRYQLLLKSYSAKLIILMFPALIITEIITWGYAILNGKRYITNKLKAYYWIITNFDELLGKRKIVRKSKKLSDKDLFLYFDYKIPFIQIIRNDKLSFIYDIIFNTLFSIHYNIIKYLI